MSELSYFESRRGKLSCNAEDVFRFVTDIRNFERFIPETHITSWQADKESCSFTVSMIGTVNTRLSEKTEFTRVVYDGDALKKNDFNLVLDISGNGEEPAEVKISLKADLNPVLRMMASKPVGMFLEMVVDEMERFHQWKEIRE